MYHVGKGNNAVISEKINDENRENVKCRSIKVLKGIPIGIYITKYLRFE